MQHWTKLLTALSAAATVAAITAALALATGTTSRGATVKVARTPLGRILVDSRGITLYDFPKDKGTTSSCYGAPAPPSGRR